MSRSIHKNDLRKLESIQVKITEMESITKDQHLRKEIRKLRSDLQMATTDTSHLHDRITELEARIANLEERKQ